MLSDSSKITSEKDKTVVTTHPWGIFAAIVLLLVGFFIAPIMLDAVLALVTFTFGDASAQAQEWLYDSPGGIFLGTMLRYGAALALIIWFVRSRKESLKRSFGLRTIQWKDIGYAIIGVVAYAVIYVIFLAIVNAIIPVDTSKEQAIGFETNVRGLSLVFAFASLVILPPLVEELIFRGFIYGTFRRRNIGAVASIITVSVVFGSLHLLGSGDGSLLWIAFIDTFVLSLVLCQLREITGGIWASIIVHALKNCLVFVNLFLLHAM